MIKHITLAVMIFAILFILLFSHAPTVAQENAPQVVTSCLNTEYFEYYTMREALHPGVSPFFVSGGLVRQRMGQGIPGHIHDTEILNMIGVNIWSGYDNVVYLESYQVGTIVLFTSNDNVIGFLDVWRDGDTWFVFALEDQFWYAVTTFGKIYEYQEIVNLYLSDPDNWGSYHWGWHPCGAFEVDREFLPY